MIKFTRAFSVPYKQSSYTKDLYELRKTFNNSDVYTGEKRFSRVGDSVRTKDNLNTVQGFEHLTHWIEKESFDFANAVFGIKKTLPITNMWGTINSKDSHWNMVHTHPESILSGVFWLSTPAGSGDLVLMNPTNIDWWTEKLFAVEKIKSNSYSGTYYRVSAKEGELIIFPSYLPHMVEPNTSDVKRISISFNIG